MAYKKRSEYQHMQNYVQDDFFFKFYFENFNNSGFIRPVLFSLNLWCTEDNRIQFL